MRHISVFFFQCSASFSGKVPQILPVTQSIFLEFHHPLSEPFISCHSVLSSLYTQFLTAVTFYISLSLTPSIKVSFNYLSYSAIILIFLNSLQFGIVLPPFFYISKLIRAFKSMIFYVSYDFISINFYNFILCVSIPRLIPSFLCIFIRIFFFISANPFIFIWICF